MQLRKRGGVYHARYYEQGERVERSTHCTDKEAAKKVALQFERDAADPSYARLQKATVNDALTILLTQTKASANAGERSKKTLEFYECKAGHLVRLLGHHTRLVELHAGSLREYINARRTERRDVRDNAPFVTASTIHKEIKTLFTALYMAKSEKLYVGDVEALMPNEWDHQYKPRERWLTRDEVMALQKALEPDHAAQVSFAVATSAELACLQRAMREDVTEEFVLLRGTKTESRKRTVPLVAEWQRSLMEYVDKHAQGKDGRLFLPWVNPSRTLKWACKRAGIERCSLNDLRRSCAHWMELDGVPNEVKMGVMGHTTTRMLELVYNRSDAKSIQANLQRIYGQNVAPVLPQPTNESCPTGAPAGGAKQAEMAKLAESGEVVLSRNLPGESSALDPIRTGDLRIRSPRTLWPSPRKKPVRNVKAGVSAPRVPQQNRK